MSIFDRILAASAAKKGDGVSEPSVEPPVEPAVPRTKTTAGKTSSWLLKAKANAPKIVEEPVEDAPKFALVEGGIEAGGDKKPSARVDMKGWTSKDTRFANQGRKAPVAGSPDLQRVLALPRRPPVDLNSPEAQKLADEMTERLGRGPRNCKCKWRHTNALNPVQAWALKEISENEGLLGVIAVGGGKTWLNILAAMVVPNCQSAVLLVPPGLVVQLWDEYVALKEHFHVPSIVFEGTRGEYIPGRPVVRVLPYSKLSRPESTDLLRQYNPDLIIADECHRLKNMRTSTTARFMRVLMARPETRFCGWSGTITKKSLKDYAHLSAIALGDNSPLPIQPHVVDEWASAIDPSEAPAQPGALKALCGKGEGVYAGFHRRLVETPGVVATKSSSIDASINFLERKAPPMPATLKEMLEDLRENGRRPDGEEFADKMEVAKCARELASGFYYKWRFPKGTNPDLIKKWREARKNWNKEVREMLSRPREHLDSPLLCYNAAERAWNNYKGDLPVWKASNWPAWAEIKDQIQYDLQAVWVDDYLAADAAEWGLKNRGLIWYDHYAFGERVAALSGLPMHGGGVDAEARIKAEKGDRSLVVSIKAHGTGRDGLQYLFDQQLVANSPSSGDTWEQLLGRLHRIGQKADEVSTYVYRHIKEVRQAVDRAIIQAKYIQGTLGSQQKLLAASYDFELDIDD